MALDKLVNSSVLDAAMRYTANRIRAKTGGSENLPFDMSAENPKGFGDAVDGIQTGSTPTGTKQITVTENGTTTEDVSGYANAEITVNVSGGVKKTVTASSYIKFNTTSEFCVSREFNLVTRSPYTKFFAHVAFLNNTENDRAGVFTDIINDANGWTANGRRIGRDWCDISWGFDVYEGAVVEITFYPIE